MKTEIIVTGPWPLGCAYFKEEEMDKAREMFEGYKNRDQSCSIRKVVVLDEFKGGKSLVVSLPPWP